MRYPLLVSALVCASGCASTPGLYLGGGLAAEDVRYFEFNRATGEGIATPRNPIGRASVGYEFQPSKRWRLSVDLTHTSSLRDGDDRGVNSAAVTVRWFPFREQ